jgi:hypothetical protein
MLVSFLFIVMSVVGLAGFCPVPAAPLGVRLTFGWSALTILLVLGAALLALPLRATSLAIAALAAIGLVARARHVFQREDWKHPAIVLGLLAAAVIAIGPGTYIPVSWDEFSHWMLATRQFVVADRLVQKGIELHVSGYTHGWPLLMAYPQALFAGYDEGRAFPAIVVLHIAVLALAFDFAARLALNRGLAKRDATVVAWAVLVVLLSAEAMWVLFPTLLWIEKPQIYSYVAVFFLAAWTVEAPDAETLGWGAIAGSALAASYLFKVAAITLVPALLIAPLLFLARRPPRVAVLTALTLFLPPLVVSVWWAHEFPSMGSCLTNPFLILTNMYQEHEGAREVAHKLARLLTDYFAGYKPVVSLAAMAGLAAGLRRPDQRPLVFMCAIFLFFYLFSLFLSYAACFTGFERQTLLSYERYGRVVLRVIHTIGLLLLVVEALVRIRGRFRVDLSERRMRVAGTLALATFLAWQGVKSHAGLREIALRQTGNDRDEIVKMIARGVAQIKSWIAPRTDGALPSVMIVTQGGNGFEPTIARYHALETLRGGPIRRFGIHGGYSFGPSRANVWMAVAPPEHIRSLAEQADILWSVKLDDYARDALAPILAACPEGPFVMRTGTTWGCPPRR